MPLLKQRIDLPVEAVRQTDNSLVFVYYLDGNMKFLEVERGEDTGELLYNNSIISDYKGSGTRMKMYHKKIMAAKGNPVQWAIEVELDWLDIVPKLCPSDVLHIVANHEYEIAGRVMGLIPYKPKGKRRSISIETNYNRAA